MDNTRKFDGLADIYDASRPDYPAAAIEGIARLVEGTAVPHLALDVGAGTGISTRLLAAALPRWGVLALEPNPDMAARARSALAERPNVSVQTAAAESLPVTDAAAGLVTVAQALHWFDRPAFYREVRRVLAPGGALAIINNNRRTADSPALSAVEDFIERENVGYSRFYRTFDIAEDLAAASDLVDVQRTVVTWNRTVTPASLANYFLSRSSAPPIVARLGLDATRSAIVDIVERNAGAAPFTIPIDCEVVSARRPPS